MVSVLSTAASEDVAHLLGGVDLALSSLQASSRRIPVLVLVQDCFKLWSSSSIVGMAPADVGAGLMKTRP